MARRNNFDSVKEMKKMLNETRKLTLENFILPEEETEVSSEEAAVEDEPQHTREDVNNIESELIQIRKIALSVINRLADQPTSDSYNTMKRIWSLVDKAIDDKNTTASNKELDY